MDYAALRAELDAGHPDTGPYDADDQVAADQLNAINRQVNRDSLTGDECFQATNPAEYNALNTGQGNSADDQGHWLAFCGRETIDPFANANVQFVTDLFGSASTTLSNLNAIRRTTVSRAVELGLGVPNAGDVQLARSLP